MDVVVPNCNDVFDAIIFRCEKLWDVMRSNWDKILHLYFGILLPPPANSDLFFIILVNLLYILSFYKTSRTILMTVVYFSLCCMHKHVIIINIKCT